MGLPVEILLGLNGQALAAYASLVATRFFHRARQEGTGEEQAKIQAIEHGMRIIQLREQASSNATYTSTIASGGQASR